MWRGSEIDAMMSFKQLGLLEGRTATVLVVAGQ